MKSCKFSSTHEQQCKPVLKSNESCNCLIYNLFRKHIFKVRYIHSGAGIVAYKMLAGYLAYSQANCSHISVNANAEQGTNVIT